jgi:hypothetical protein
MGTASSKAVAVQTPPVRPTKVSSATPLQTNTTNVPATATPTVPITQIAQLANAPSHAAPAQAPPVASSAIASPLKTATANIHGSDTPTVPATQLPRLANSKVSSGLGPAQIISIKTSNRAWVIACADGSMVFSKLFNKGEVEEVHFASQATIRSGNGAATELVIGNQPIGSMNAGVTTIAVTPEGHQYVSALSCKAQ